MPNSIDLPSLLARLRAAGSTTDCLRVLVDSRSLARHVIVGFREQLRVPAITRMPRPQWWAERMGWPKGFLQEWIRRNLAGLDPALTGAHIRPGMLAHWTMPDPTFRRVRGNGERLRLDAAEFLISHGIRTGVVAAVRRGSGHVGYVSWLLPSSSQPLSVTEARGLVLLAELFFDALDRVRPPDPGRRLSVIERRCLDWSAYGCTDKEIAVEMHCSMDTIRFHMKKILKKLGAANRTHAVAVAMQDGLIRLGSTPHHADARMRSGSQPTSSRGAGLQQSQDTITASPAPRQPRPSVRAGTSAALPSSARPRIRRARPGRTRSRAASPP